MKGTLFKIHVLASLLILSSMSCSHAPTQKDPSAQPTLLGSSRIEISYELRHTRRRFIAEAKEQKITGRTYLDQKMIVEGKIDSASYREFFQKTIELIQKTQRTPAQNNAPCRDRFKLTLTQGVDLQSIQGCRQEEGMLGRLIQEGERLIRPQK